MKHLILLALFVSCDYQDTSKVFANPRVETLKVSDTEEREKIFKKFEQYTSEFPKTSNIQPDEALSLLDPLYIDVREKREYKVSMIKNAITLKEFNQNREAYRNRELVIYCTIGYRSGLFSEKLLSEGFKSYNLLGGVLLWSHFGYKFYQNSIETNNVHVYSNSWNHLHSSYKAKY